MSASHLHKEVEDPKRRDDGSDNWSGDEDDGARPQNVKHGAHEHLDDARDHGVDGVRLLGEAVDQVPAGSAFEKRHGRAQDIVQHGLVKVARRQDPTDRYGDGVREHGDSWERRGERHTALFKNQTIRLGTLRPPFVLFKYICYYSQNIHQGAHGPLEWIINSD